MRIPAFIISILLAAKGATAACSDFTNTTKLTIPYASYYDRVSPIVHCTQHLCNLNSTGNTKVQGTLNITGLSEADLASIFHTIQASKAKIHQKVFPAAACASIKGYGFSIKRGQTGYIRFRPQYDCISGYLSGCRDGPVANHTYVHACASKVLADDVVSGKKNSPNGILSLKFTDGEPDPTNPATKVKC